MAEVSVAINTSVKMTFTYDRYVPDFYERVLGDDATRFINTFQTVDATSQFTRFHPDIMWVGGRDKAPLRQAAVDAGLPAQLAWREKDPRQRSTGMFGALAHAARQVAASFSAGYADPMGEDGDLVAARLLLAFLKASWA